MPEDHFKDVYTTKSAKYDAMVSREDYQGNILPALEKIRPLAGLEVVEMGAGTGRLTRLLVPRVNSITAYDMSPEMLEIARITLAPLGKANWTLSAHSHENLSAPDASADLCIAGWTFSHATGWHQERWQEEIETYLAEMERVLKPGGTAIIIETMGTGQEKPSAPNETLAAYYGWLISSRGFSYDWIRTDYQFESVAEADELTRFFFGDALADRILSERMTILPECTGIFWKHI